MNIRAMLAPNSFQPRLLMCPPRHFAVTYSINPWMDPQTWADGGATLHAEARRQWAKLRASGRWGRDRDDGTRSRFA